MPENTEFILNGKPQRLVSLLDPKVAYTLKPFLGFQNGFVCVGFFSDDDGAAHVVSCHPSVQREAAIMRAWRAFLFLARIEKIKDMTPFHAWEFFDREIGDTHRRTLCDVLQKTLPIDVDAKKLREELLASLPPYEALIDLVAQVLLGKNSVDFDELEKEAAGAGVPLPSAVQALARLARIAEAQKNALYQAMLEARDRYEKTKML